MSPWVQYWLWVATLAALLFLPATKLIWVLSVRRMERKLGHGMSHRERLGQQNRARFIAFLLCFTFAALFNYQSLNMAAHG